MYQSIFFIIFASNIYEISNSPIHNISCLSIDIHIPRPIRAAQIEALQQANATLTTANAAHEREIGHAVGVVRDARGNHIHRS